MRKIKNVSWNYFIVFSFLIIIFMWFFLSLFFDNYYYYIKNRNANIIANEVIKYQNDKDFNERLNVLSYERKVCVEVVDSSYNMVYKSDNLNIECRFHNNHKIDSFLKEFINSNKETQKDVIKHKRNNKKVLIISKKLDNNRYAFITTQLEPNDFSSFIIRDQLIYISILIIVLSFVISYFISRRFSRPLIEINNQSKSIIKEDINVNTNILEINELVDTLNYARKELLKTQELRRDFISNVSHDMKTPLTMIKAYADMINDLHKDDYEKRVEDSKIIIEEVNRLDAFISDVLDLSKMQSNVYELKIEKFNIISLIESIINRFNGLVLNENIIFEFNHDNKRIMVRADKSKIEQVLYNLISNAINYVGKDKKVIIDANNNEDDVLIKITDHGSGISKEELPNIWSKYYKIDKNFHRKKISNGIGLAIVKRILETHDFQYGVNSIVNEGSTFWFKIKK